MANGQKIKTSPWAEDDEADETDFQEKSDSKMKTFLKFFSVAVFVVVVGFAGYYYVSRPTGANASIEFSKPSQILSGQPFTLAISASNNSDQVLNGARLSVYLPDGVYNLNGSQDQRVIENSLGDIGPGSVSPNNFKLLVVGDSQAVKRIEAKLSYRLSGSTAEFENKSEVDLSVGQQAVDLSFETPQGVFGGSNFDINVKYQNNSDQDFKNVVLRMNYPQGFVFSKGSIDSSADGTQWDLGELPKGTNGNFTISGSVTGNDNALFEFRGEILAGFGGQTFTVAEQTANVSLSVSPLSISVSVNGAEDYVARAGDDLTYNIRYKNNSDFVFSNVTIKASLSGEMFDFPTLTTNASFDSIRNVLTWMTANTPALSQVQPGAEGAVSATVKLKRDFPIRRLSDKNYILRVQAEINSPTVPPGTNASKTMSLANYETKVAGKVSIQAKALWRDASSGILNKGPYPPRVNQPTQYTVHWIVSNYSTDVSGVQASAFLQSGARWTGVVKASTEKQPEYDPSSGKVTWDIGDLMATKGVVGQPAEAIFQIELTPAANQLNQMVPLLSNTNIQWQDNFVGTQFSGSAQTLTTALPDDTTISASTNRVVQP